MIHDILPENVLFLDIETVPMCSDYHSAPEPFKTLWEEKCRYLTGQENTPGELFARAGIYAEFGKIVCICTGRLSRSANRYRLKIEKFYGDDEKAVLTDFRSYLLNHLHADHVLCAHNGKEFDFPYISRRMLVHGIPLPPALNTAGKKPWEIRHLDTMELWKFGDYKNFTSLRLLAAIFNIQSPKTDIDGSKVHEVYWKEKNLPRITSYCSGDVVTIARLFLKYQNKPALEDQFITFA